MCMSGTSYIFEPLWGIGQMLACVPMGMEEVLQSRTVQQATLGCTPGLKVPPQLASWRASPHGRGLVSYSLQCFPCRVQLGESQPLTLTQI